MAIIRLNKTAFFNNLEIITKKAKGLDKVAVVLKDNAYGHGLSEMAQLSKEYGLSRAVVRNVSEAQRVERYFEYILVLADIPKSVMPYHFAINDLNSICKFPKNSKVELKVDTGMHRNGIAVHTLEEAFNRLQKQNLQLKGVMTHYRSADVLSSEQYFQVKRFDEVKTYSRTLAKKYGLGSLHFHSCNSAGLFRRKEFDEAFARVGIAAYGCLDMPDLFNVPALQPVLSLYAHKLGAIDAGEGCRIGYGGTYQKKAEALSVYDIGYGDGWSRALSNNYTAPCGERLVGRVSMDNSVFASEKEELLLFDDANAVAQRIDTIGYEVLVGLHGSIERQIN